MLPPGIKLSLQDLLVFLTGNRTVPLSKFPADAVTVTSNLF